jgi:hypothetical protein
MAGALPTRTNRALGLAEKTILGVIAGGAAAIAVIDLVLLVQRIVDLVTPGPTVLPGVMLAQPLEPSFDASEVTAAVAPTVDLTVGALPGGAIVALVAAAVLTSLLTVGICLVVAWLCLRVFLGKPFVRSATWGIGAVAILVLLSGLGGPLLTAIAYADTASAFAITELAPFMVEIDLSPLGWTFALAVVAGAFELGQRMQRDTESLV